MTLELKRQNLFYVPDDYYLAHCISADYNLGAGIAVDFNKKFHLKNKLKQLGSGKYPDCILIDEVFNLVTKNKYFNKPTYSSLEKSLQMMKNIMIERNINKIATYKLGCTRDKLSWPKVRELIESIFSDTDDEFIICIL